MIRRLLTATGAGVVAVFSLAGCASAPQAAGEAPADFALSLCIYKPATGRLPGWYVIQPDGVLRAVVGERQENTPLPPIVRQLDPQDRERLWELVEQAGLSAKTPPEGVVRGPEWVSSREATATLALAAHGTRTSLVAAEQVESITRLEGLVRELAWLSGDR
ncbi:MAG: hypothetical protein ACOYN0_06705 [Phycisphaerales bacterium]